MTYAGAPTVHMGSDPPSVVNRGCAVQARRLVFKKQALHVDSSRSALHSKHAPELA